MIQGWDNPQTPLTAPPHIATNASTNSYSASNVSNTPDIATNAPTSPHIAPNVSAPPASPDIATKLLNLLLLPL